MTTQVTCRITGLLGAVFLHAAPTLAIGCDGGGFDIVQPLRSPLETFAEADRSGPESRGMTFGSDLRVHREMQNGLLQLCETKRWLDPSDIVRRRSSLFAQISADRDGIDRPSLTFWLHVRTVATFLSGVDTLRDGPDLQQPAGSLIAAPMRFPVVQVIDVANLGRGRQVAEVLLPVDSAALAALSRVADAAAAPGALIVLDFSGNSVGFARLTLQRALSGLASGAEPDTGNMIAIGPGDRAGEVGPLSLTEMLSSNDGTAAEATLSERLGSLGDDTGREVVLLLAGDIAVPDVPLLRHAAAITIAQITPELDTELAASVAALRHRKSVRFLPFGPDQAEQLAPIFQRLLRPEGGTLQQRAIADVARAQSLAGLLPLLPLSELARERFGAVDADLDWIALPVWTVPNPDLLTLTP